MSRLSEERRQAQDEYLREAALAQAVLALRIGPTEPDPAKVVATAQTFLAFLVAGQPHA